MGQDISITDAALKKAAWHEAGQKLYAQNIANADTPGYRPLEMKTMDFKTFLGSSTSKVSLTAAGGGVGRASGLATTNAAHISSGSGSGVSSIAQEQKQKTAYEVSPSGNAVVLEEQMIKASENLIEHDKAIGIYEKNMAQLRRVLRDQ